ncbi:hypothetical protein Tco_0623703, partial [Tanacetum coccineum]
WTAFHFPKGLYNSPSGARFIGGAQAVSMNTPCVAGRFALWGGLFSTFKVAFDEVPQVEDKALQAAPRSWFSRLFGQKIN